MDNFIAYIEKHRNELMSIPSRKERAMELYKLSGRYAASLDMKNDEEKVELVMSLLPVNMKLIGATEGMDIEGDDEISIYLRSVMA